MSMTLEGADRLVRKLGAMPARVNDEVTDEMEHIGDDIKAESVELAPYRPKDPDSEEQKHLREYAYSRFVSRSLDGATLDIGYDGPDPYLGVQHEGGWLNLIAWGVPQGPTRITNYTTPGTGPKFLERPWAANLPRTRQRMQRAVKRGVRG